jgi:acyl carrier protein
VARENDFDLRSWVRQQLAQRLGRSSEDIVLDKSIEDFGLDSIDAVELAGELEQALGIEIDPAAFLNNPTLEASIAALVFKLFQR